MSCISMSEITQKDYEEFSNIYNEVNVGNEKIKLHRVWDVSNLSPSEDYRLEDTTFWSFPERGRWATHTSNYRGNWSPYIPRNLILKYTKVGDLILDQMIGSGTTLVECKLLNRNGIGVDINRDAIMITRDRLNFSIEQKKEKHNPILKTYAGDARNLDKIDSECVDLIATHPPYAKIISYTRTGIEGDLSGMSISKYIEEMRKVAEECIRVLKPNKYCAILIGDTRSSRHYIPIAFRVMQQFLDVGFVLKEDIIKRQWKMKITRERWKGRNKDFYLISHEHLFIFRKLSQKEKVSKYKYSSKWRS